MISPSQQIQWQQLQYAKTAGRLPHALLLAGARDALKAAFADAFTRALLCEQPIEGYGCNHCHACRMIESKVHPNVRWITPEKEGQAIKVDQIREASEFIQQSSLQGEYRILLIHPADQMNVNAANALLKTLEEPPSGALLILVSDAPSRLPATILSRCQRVYFHHSPKVDDSSDVRQIMYDELSRGMEIDPIKSAAKIKPGDVLPALDFALNWMTDLLWLQMKVDANRVTNRDYITPLSALAASTQLKHNLALVTYLQECRAQLSTGFNLNKPLILETFFIRWMRCVC